MGHVATLDALGSVVIGGFLLLTLFRLNNNASENTYHYTGELLVQENIVSVGEQLEYDFRKIGYCEEPLNIPNPGRAILYADTSTLTFLTDVEFDGDVDTVSYYLGPTSELSETPNPDDRLLYRSVNGVPIAANLGITKFYITYYSILGLELSTPLSVPTGIFSMQIDLSVENTAAFENEFRFAFWRQLRLASRNLFNR